jgi:hypothetical protein
MKKVLIQGYNCREAGNFDEKTVFAHAMRLGVSGMMFVDLDTAWRFKQQFPVARVHYRCMGEEGHVPTSIAPADWLKIQLRKLDERGIPHDALILHPTNEPLLSAPLIAWYEGLTALTLAMPESTRPIIGMFDFAVGNPHQDDWVKLHNLLDIATKHPKWFSISLHEYCAGVWTSGVNDAQPGNYITDPTKWATMKANGNCWHMGRWRWGAAYCDRTFQAMPVFDITECGFDDIPDVHAWEQALLKVGDTVISGWRTLANQWAQWSLKGWSTERMLLEQTIAYNDVLYADDYVAPSGRVYVSPVASTCGFSMGSFGGTKQENNYQRWLNYDYTGAGEYQSGYESYAQARRNTNVAVVVPPNKGKSISVSITGSSFNLRVAEGVNATRIGLVGQGETVTLYPDTLRTSGGYSWYFIERPAAPLGQPTQGWIAYDLPIVPPPPPPPAPEPPKPTWRDSLDNRELKEVEFATLYAYQFAHGTSGHIEYMLIAKLAKMLDNLAS